MATGAAMPRALVPAWRRRRCADWACHLVREAAPGRADCGFARAPLWRRRAVA